MWKPFFLTFVVTLVISGCAPATVHDKAESIQEFAAMLDGKEMSLKNVDGVSENPEYGYDVIRAQIAMVRWLCKKDGGELSGRYYYRLNATNKNSEVIKALSFRSTDKPSSFVCKKPDADLWGLEIDHKGFRRSWIYVYFTPYVKVLSPQELQRQREISKAESEENLRRSQEEAKARMEQAMAADAIKKERDAKFRANLKQGDLCQWKLREIVGYGMVVRIEGKLAFVQFENVTFAGQNTRYVPIAELEAPEKRASSTRYSIP